MILAIREITKAFLLFSIKSYMLSTKGTMCITGYIGNNNLKTNFMLPLCVENEIKLLICSFKPANVNIFYELWKSLHNEYGSFSKYFVLWTNKNKNSSPIWPKANFIKKNSISKNDSTLLAPRSKSFRA